VDAGSPISAVTTTSGAEPKSAASCVSVLTPPHRSLRVLAPGSLNAVGSVTGTIAGGLLLGIIPSVVLIPLLAALLTISSIKVWRHEV
jgi:uncharacterized membrane protein YfcA